MEPLLGLTITLPQKDSRELRHSLHRQLRAAIAGGRLQPGMQMPGTRTLARHLGISRNTIIAVYDLLFSEGYLVGRGGSGTYVTDIGRIARVRETPPVAKQHPQIAGYWQNNPEHRANSSKTYQYDFGPGLPDVSNFPLHIWQRLSGRALRRVVAEPFEIAPQGRRALREAIVHHVSFYRAVACQSDDIIVTAGAQQAFDLIARTLVTPGKTEVAVEDPGYPPIFRAFEAAGAHVHFIPVDYEGVIVDRIPESARVICVSPSHQFPLGVAMSARRRSALLDFAQTFNAIIIEDDYDGEFRIEGRPTSDALQTLDCAGTTFYVGTFSKCLFPELRLGFIVAPSWARHALLAAKQMADGFCPVPPQDTLAAFISEGHLARHIRKMRKLYNQRHNILVQALRRHCSEKLSIIPGSSGIHIAAQLSGDLNSAEISKRAKDASIKLWTLEHYVQHKSTWTGLLFGYGKITTADIEPAIVRLERLL